MSEPQPTAPHPGPTSPWMTVPEAAKYARRGHGAIYTACRTGELVATQTYEPRGTWIIHRDAIDDWIRAASNRKPAKRQGRAGSPRQLRARAERGAA